MKYNKNIKIIIDILCTSIINDSILFSNIDAVDFIINTRKELTNATIKYRKFIFDLYILIGKENFCPFLRRTFKNSITINKIFPGGSFENFFSWMVYINNGTNYVNLCININNETISFSIINNDNRNDNEEPFILSNTLAFILLDCILKGEGDHKIVVNANVLDEAAMDFENIFIVNRLNVYEIDIHYPVDCLLGSKNHLNNKHEELDIIKSICRENVYTSGWTIDDLASTLNTNKRYIQRLLRRHNTTFSKIIKAEREEFDYKVYKENRDNFNAIYSYLTMK
ncbi:helix-turn-helix transcriptional regulator [Vibrio cholerae]|uniref:hypothetical protein n=1 Tax=Vibrio cholerae TaxID=666 RepID=UPI0039678D39